VTDRGSRKRRKKGKARKAVRDERQVELLPDEGADGDGATGSASKPELEPAVEQGTGSVPEVVIEAADGPSPEPNPAATPRVADTTPSSDARAEPTVRPAGNQLARARDLVEQGRVHEAIDLYGEIVADNPESMKAHNNLGVLFDELGQHETAITHFEEALRIDPDSVEVLTNHGGSLTSVARYDDAETVIRRALRFSPDDIDARLALGVLTFRRGLYPQCESELRWVCDRDPENGLAFYYRAEALNRIGHFEDAGALMEQAAELMPNDPRPFYTLGHLYDRNSLHTEAAEMYRRARELQVS